jgi:ferric-dicitrate binding protein FerR (iron transport regulator)
METGEQRSSYITDPGDVLLVVSMDVHFFWTATEFVVCLYEGRLVFMAAHNARNPDNFDRVVTE